MVGSKTRKTGWLAAACTAALLGCGASGVRAELLHSFVSTEETHTPGFTAFGSAPRAPLSHGREDWRAVWNGLRNECDSLQREVATTAMTMFFIRGGTPPSTPPGPGGNASPPGQSNTPPGGNGNLPPPGGNGEAPPGDPGDPVGSPEPASLVMGLLGAGLIAVGGWRKRRQLSLA